MLTKVTSNEIRDRIIDRIHAYRIADDHAVMRPDLDRLLRYARKLYQAAIPTLTADLQVHTTAILAAWDMSVIEALGDEDHAWACHQAAETCIGMRKALSASGQTELRPELQLCHIALVSPWSVQLEVAVERAREAAALSISHPGITGIYGDYATIDACQPGDVEAAAVRAAMRSAREGCYRMMENAGSVEISNTLDGQELDITTEFCALGEAAIERIMHAEWAKDPKPLASIPVPPDVQEARDAYADREFKKLHTSREVRLCVERLAALEDYEAPVAEAVRAAEPVVAALVPARGKVVALMGPSGAGKTSILEALLASDPGLVRSISWTTRAPRDGERDGVDYHFRSCEQFDALVGNGGMLEHDIVYGRSYGIPRAPVEAAIAAGQTVVLVIHVDGFRRLRAALPGDVVGVGVLASSASVLEARLLARGDEQESVDARMRAARYESDAAEILADCTVVNRSLEQAIGQVRCIVGGLSDGGLSMAA